MGKQFKGFRFQPHLYVDFTKVALSGGYTVTGAFEKFMSGCVELDMLVFPDQKIWDLESEARVLADWLDKGKYFYRSDNGEEVNVQGRLLWLLPKIHDRVLQKEIEDALTKSVTTKQ